jgi:hypothetical protein
MITIEVYSNTMFNDPVTSHPTGLENALEFVKKFVPDEAPFVDIYVDFTDDEKPFYQKTFSLLGCDSKTEALNFIVTIWETLCPTP